MGQTYVVSANAANEHSVESSSTSETVPLSTMCSWMYMFMEYTMLFKLALHLEVTIEHVSTQAPNSPEEADTADGPDVAPPASPVSFMVH